MFRITDGKGFQITFDNGWTASVQFGIGNYCNNRDYMEYGEEGDRVAGSDGCANAEIAAWDADGVWYDFGSDTVLGWVGPTDVLGFLLMIASLDAGKVVVPLKRFAHLLPSGAN
jgi:hypothetical protein